MLGKDLFKIDNAISLSQDELKSLLLFYGPIIGNDALTVYLSLYYFDQFVGYKALNDYLEIYNLSIDEFEEAINKLNEYKLITTLKEKNGSKYIFVLKKALNSQEFINNNLFVRSFVLKTNGNYLQELSSSIRSSINNREGFDDISKKFDASNLSGWNSENETYLKLNNTGEFKIDSFFDINKFLKGISLNLLPMKFRTYDNLSAISSLADLYNISYDKMAKFIPQISKSGSDTFDLKYLKYLCMNAQNDNYTKYEEGNYNVPCNAFLMSLQDGKEVSNYDKKIIFELNNKYHLKPSVINVLLEHSLKACDNRLIEKYLYGVASDLHRNDINDVNSAKEFLKVNTSSKTTKKETIPSYNNANNSKINMDLAEQYLKDRNKNA